MADAHPVALVTGVSSGIGQAIGTRLAEAGYRVYGGMRSPKPEATAGRLIPLRIDLNDDASMKTAVAEILAAEGRIDVLVNNAGMTLFGSIEETAIEQARALFETDFFGAARLAQLVLPSMRAQKSGRIVNIGSVMGVIPAAFMGYYSAAKHAVEGYTESLDHETRPFGVRAIVIEPGFTRTRLGVAAAAASGSLPDYEHARRNAEKIIGQYVEQGDDPGLVATAVLTAVRARVPRRVPKGGRSRRSGGSRRRGCSIRSSAGSSDSTPDAREVPPPRGALKRRRRAPRASAA